MRGLSLRCVVANVTICAAETAYMFLSHAVDFPVVPYSRCNQRADTSLFSNVVAVFFILPRAKQIRRPTTMTRIQRTMVPHFHTRQSGWTSSNSSPWRDWPCERSSYLGGFTVSHHRLHDVVGCSCSFTQRGVRLGVCNAAIT